MSVKQEVSIFHPTKDKYHDKVTLIDINTPVINKVQQDNFYLEPKKFNILAYKYFEYKTTSLKSINGFIYGRYGITYEHGFYKIHDLLSGFSLDAGSFDYIETKEQLIMILETLQEVYDNNYNLLDTSMGVSYYKQVLMNQEMFIQQLIHNVVNLGKVC